MQENVLECLNPSLTLHGENGRVGKKQEEFAFQKFPHISHLFADIIYSAKFIVFIDF